MNKKAILSSFFRNKSTQKVAKDLLGTFLLHESKQGITVGRIVEVEAYLPKNDPACHAHKGKTKRNEVMFGPAGNCYVYLCYGMYHLFNIVTGPEGSGEAVLIRALEPIKGIDLMMKRRKVRNANMLCSGPGKLVIAMGINEKHNGLSLESGPISLYPRASFNQPSTGKKDRFSIVTTTRIGIHHGSDLPLRYYVKDNPFISKF